MAKRADLESLNNGLHSNPFALLGLHKEGRQRIVRTLQPGAEQVLLLNADAEPVAELKRVDGTDIFEAPMPARLRRYRLRINYSAGITVDIEDPYRFATSLGETDLYLLGEGSDQQIHKKLGAHVMAIDGISGTRFAVWAPNASRVSVVGEFNAWNGRQHVMRLHPANGVWEIFLPGIGNGVKYKYEILDAAGNVLPLKSDPWGAWHEPPPGNASVVFSSDHEWHDDDWMRQRSSTPAMNVPISIYEVHAGSWRRHDDGSLLSWRELAAELVPYVKAMGFTHLELLPISEHPFDGSWGYQPIGLVAPTHRFGTPDDFRFFVDACHAAGLSVIIDWVPAHFPKDEHGLRQFDGTALYEHQDPRKGEHVDWGTLIFNFGRREVVNYLVGTALCWIKDFHIDAIRVDAVASMLYLDYSREDGEWLPNEHGGRENLEAVEFLRRFNAEIHAAGATSYAEESTAWPGVSKPVDAGGLGFTFKWNMGWMNDTLSYMSEDPVHRRYHHDKMTFGLVYAFDENFVLPLSHDEVVHGKRSLLGRMPGDDWQQFANLRAYYAAMYAHPGKKLLFMGAEIAQRNEWNHDQSLDWHLLEHGSHAGVQNLLRDLNHVYSATPALFERDFDSAGFEWLDWEDSDNSVLAWRRIDNHGGDLLCVSNLTPVVREDYRIGVPTAGTWRERLNTDSEHYGGSNKGNPPLTTENKPCKGRPASLKLTLPPLATIYLGRD
ncbi:MAG: 1,4-alpha-glucan branching protein GlgB [Pseudomonadota bacterium]